MAEIILNTVDGLIHIRAPFALKDDIKGLPDRQWLGPPVNPDGPKVWAIPATPTAVMEFHRRFGNYPTIADQTYQDLLKEGQESAKAAIFKTAVDLEDLPTKTVAWGHQRQGFHFARAHPAAMLAMDMGTGKSLTAIGLLEDIKAMMVVIVGPRRALPVWPREFQRHATRDWHVIVPPLNATVQRRAHHVIEQLGAARILGKPAAVCVNYESYWRDAMATVLKSIPIDVIIFDEIHRIKAPGGKASKFAQTLRRRAKRAFGLTGTPMPHSPLDVYAQYRALDSSIFGTSFARFRARYAVMGGFEGRQVVGYQNEAELAEKFGSISFVCKSDDVLDLPEYHHVPLYCDLEPAARKMYTRLDEEFVTMIDKAPPCKTCLGGGSEDCPECKGVGIAMVDNALVKLLRLQQLTAGFLKDEEGNLHRVSTAKEELLVDTLADFKVSDPLVLVARFHTDLDIFGKVCTETVKDELGASRIRRFGELSGRVKENNALYGLDHHGMMRDDIDVIGVQLQAGGVGIDLTRSNYNLFYSMGYNLGDYMQMLRRSHRPGQDRPVTYFHLICNGTKDESVYEALANRQNVVEAVIAASRR